ncbi:hypothetical protein AO269_18890 [Pseudomonas putida]|nr:hypothetical protein AO269_18890 [Pseudomonas putida]
MQEVVAPYNRAQEQVLLRLEPTPPFPLRRVSMKRLLNNLIGNALYHAGSGVEVAVNVSGDDNAPYVWVWRSSSALPPCMAATWNCAIARRAGWRRGCGYHWA